MSCQYDSSGSIDIDDGCRCDENVPYLSNESLRRSGTKGDKRINQRKINIPAKCRGTKDVDTVNPMDTGCVSLQYRRRSPCARPLSAKQRKPRCKARGPEPLPELPPCRKVEEATLKRSKKLLRGGRRASHRSGECATGDDVRVPCGVAMEDFGENFEAERRKKQKIAALEKTLSKSQWYDEDGYHSASVSVSQIYHPESEYSKSGKPCASEKRRNMLRAQLRELLNETAAIPESCLQDIAEAKPEPEVLAEVLLMSEAQGIDLAGIKPRNVFDNLFSDMTNDPSIAISNADPELMSDVVVPVDGADHRTLSFEMPNPETMIEQTRRTPPPNPSAFQKSAVYESFSDHMSELMNKTPTNQNISELLGSKHTEDNTMMTEDSIVDYVMKPGAPDHVNRVRLNGTIKPVWFPGYVLVSPPIPGCIRMTNDPGEALREAWRLCRPQCFDDRSRHLVDVA